MDIFLEEMVKRKKNKSDFLMIFLIGWASVALSLAVIMLAIIVPSISPMIGYILSIISPVMVIFIWYFAYRFYLKFNIEYEYSMINSNLDIDKIISKRDRKRVISIDVKDAQFIACVDDAENNYIYKNLPQGVELLNCGSGTDERMTYFIDCYISGKRKIVLFQPTEKMVDALRKFNAKAVKKFDL